MSAATCRGDRTLYRGRRGVRHVDEAVVTFDQNVDVAAVHASIAAGGWQRGIEKGDHGARLAHERLREIGDDTEGETAGR